MAETAADIKARGETVVLEVAVACAVEVLGALRSSALGSIAGCTAFAAIVVLDVGADDIVACAVDVEALVALGGGVGAIDIVVGAVGSAATVGLTCVVAIAVQRGAVYNTNGVDSHTSLKFSDLSLYRCQAVAHVWRARTIRYRQTERTTAYLA
jgi:hypothetical protein